MNCTGDITYGTHNTLARLRTSLSKYLKKCTVGGKQADICWNQHPNFFTSGKSDYCLIILFCRSNQKVSRWQTRRTLAAVGCSRRSTLCDCPSWRNTALRNLSFHKGIVTNFIIRRKKRYCFFLIQDYIIKHRIYEGSQSI